MMSQVYPTTQHRVKRCWLMLTCLTAIQHPSSSGLCPVPIDSKVVCFRVYACLKVCWTCPRHVERRRLIHVVQALEPWQHAGPPLSALIILFKAESCEGTASSLRKLDASICLGHPTIHRFIHFQAEFACAGHCSGCATPRLLA